MARKYTTHIREEKAVELRIDVPNLETYKDAWLILNNTARNNPDMIYKVSNVEGTDFIYVLAPPQHKERIIDFMSQFYENVEVITEEKYVVFVDVGCEYTGNFDDDYIDSEYVFGELD